MIKNGQLNERISYAERRRNGYFRNSKRVLWKTRSNVVA